MPPKNKGVKMSLDSFLQDESLGGGSWADDAVDFSSIEIPTGSKANTGFTPSGGANLKDPAFGGNDFDGPRRDRGERVEYPIPDAPPYRARLNNLAWDDSEENIGAWFNDNLGDDEAVLRVVAPKDHMDPTRLKGFAFVTFNTREQLEKALTFSASEINGRRVFVSVAQPERESYGSRRGGDDVTLDWGAARGSGVLPQREQREPREDRPRREEPNLDWGSARGSGALPPRQPREPREDRPRREEPNLDWGSARGSGALPPRQPREPREPREDRPKREEPNLDWGSARGSGVLPPREPRAPREPREPREDRPKREEPNLDWGSARGSGSLPQREPRAPREPREDKPKREEPALDWGSARGSGVLPPKRTGNKEGSWSRGQSARGSAQQNENNTEKSKPAIKKSVYAVLATEDDDDEKTESVTELENATKSLTVEDA